MSQRRQQRKSQSKEIKKKTVFWGRFLLASIVVIMVALVVAYQMVFKFLHSDGFREQMNQELSGKLGAPVVLGKLKWDGLHLENESFTAQSEGAIVNVEATGIELNLSTNFLKREVWDISDLVIQNADLELDLRKSFSQIKLLQKEQSWLEKLLPPKADLFDGRVLSADASIKTEGGEYAISRTLVDFQKQREIEEITLSDGKLALPFPLLDKAELKIAKFRFVNHHLVIDQAELSVFEKGKLELDGEVNLEEFDYSLYGAFSGLTCADVISEDWKQRLQGDIESSFTVKPKLNKEPEIRGQIKIHDGQLTALPVLDLIAAYTAIRDFKRLRFSEFRCDFYKYGQLLKFENIYVHCDRVMRIEGKLDIEGESLNGTFQVGINPGTLSHIPGAEDKVFLPGKEGMHWATVHITGSLGKIEEDLSRRIKSAALDRMFEMIGSKKVLRFTNQAMDSIDRVSGEINAATVSDVIKEARGKLIDVDTIEEPVKTGRDLIQSGLESIFGGSN